MSHLHSLTAAARLREIVWIVETQHTTTTNVREKTEKYQQQVVVFTSFLILLVFIQVGICLSFDFMHISNCAIKPSRSVTLSERNGGDQFQIFPYDSHLSSLSLIQLQDANKGDIFVVGCSQNIT